MWDFLIIFDMLNLETDYNKIPVRHNFDHMVLFLSSIVCLIATFSNISVISWRSVLLVEETREPGGKTLPQVTDKLYHIMLYTSPWLRF